MIRVREGVDQGLVWHTGNPVAEQRAMEQGDGWVKLDNREIFEIKGPDRLSWLHSLTSQHMSDLAPGQGVTSLVLSPNGRIEQVLFGIDNGSLLAWSEPARAQGLIGWLNSMRFMMQVEIIDRPDLCLWWVGDNVTLPKEAKVKTCDFSGREVLLPADTELSGVQAGTWALDAFRLAAGVPRIFVDTDERTIPNEIGLYGTHLDKGCYRGQETVARIQSLGRPARRLVMLHLDGSMDMLPQEGDDLTYQQRRVGFVGSVARHYELGPIGLGLVKRATPVDATLFSGDIAANQQIIVDPDVGLHFRPNL